VTRTPLSQVEIDSLVRKYPQLPADYLDYLRDTGWGESESGYMIYSGPVSPSDVYSKGGEMPNLIVLGDDFQGFCLAYCIRDRIYGEITDNGEWCPSQDGTTIIDYASGSP
jgi:hypothetical protein